MGKAMSLDMKLRSMCLTGMVSQVEPMAQRAQKEGWTFIRYVEYLCDVELAERSRRKTERLLKQAALPEGKTLESLNQEIMPLKTRRQLSTLLEGDWVDRAENILIFGLPGRGKTHLACAIARELILKLDCRVYFTTTFHLVQQLLTAKRDLKISALLDKLQRFDIIVLDDIGYVQQSREEMEVLFTFLAERYERKSLIITSNLVFSEWDKIFKDPMTTAAAIDRLVHHAVILELDGDSYRAKNAKERKQKGGETK
jgi:DNA replication protein DnaC